MDDGHDDEWVENVGTERQATQRDKNFGLPKPWNVSWKIRNTKVVNKVTRSGKFPKITEHSQFSVIRKLPTTSRDGLPFPSCVVVARSMKETATAQKSRPNAGNKTATEKLSSLPNFVINDSKTITKTDSIHPMFLAVWKFAKLGYRPEKCFGRLPCWCSTLCLSSLGSSQWRRRRSRIRCGCTLGNKGRPQCCIGRSHWNLKRNFR